MDADVITDSEYRAGLVRLRAARTEREAAETFVRPVFPPSQFDSRNEWGDIREDEWWQAGEFETSDAQGMPRTIGYGTGEW